MNRDDLIARVKAIIAEAYEEAAELVVEYLEKHPGEQLQPLCKEIDPDNWNALRKRVQRAREARNATPDAESERRRAYAERKAREHTRRMLRDPDQRQRVMDDLPTEQVEEIAQAATEVAVERSRAARAEHQTKPTVGELTGSDRFDPAEYWADTLVIRVNRNARELAKLIERAGGLLFGTMTPDEAFDYLHEAERLIAEARAAAQEQVRDRTEVGS